MRIWYLFRISSSQEKVNHLPLDKRAAISQTNEIFSCILVDEIFYVLIKISLKFVSNWQWPNIGLDIGLAPNRRQAITWTNTDPIHWRIYAALGGDELKDRAYSTGLCAREIPKKCKWLKDIIVIDAMTSSGTYVAFKHITTPIWYDIQGSSMLCSHYWWIIYTKEYRGYPAKRALCVSMAGRALLAGYHRLCTLIKRIAEWFPGFQK